MISIASPVFAVDPLAVIPAVAPDAQQTESQGVSFAELLMEMDAGPEKTTETSVAPAEMQKMVKSTSLEEPDIPESPSLKVADEPADVVALAYAFVAAIPMPEPTATPTPTLIAAPARTSIDSSITSPASLPSQSKPSIGSNIAEILPDEDAVEAINQPELTTVTAKPHVAATAGIQTPGHA